ncbi:DNA-binding winged helix-turn-helix (wHTH) protein/tetratricopeptide (TPR) repeat protein [Sphingomonas kaistensis]|uniref:DNA-binding winged helix-turn-helix (WHTH) protein/tetratricopeptide (TPR) repeat protein n=1 Tax=Sphingomonas kaistensis TaxID=298708 RepID=A0A7X5Y5H7_9SPHN|nr:winged helix-turn-helix domain-containing protein [Sphingomonas kaistensis]NJC05190.1 DNA-binding winged helix-turn-helix (wHTH) protein/tetratricopeptide (TPR) repeat protein [Sphingomonas kaistensis]
MDMLPSKLITTADLADVPAFMLGTAKVVPATRTVTGPGGSVQVEPRVMQVLVVLARAEGAVVTREELFGRCWGGVYVGDDSLNRAVGGVRKLGAGVGAGSFCVETVPRTGYRLEGAVVWSGFDSDDDEVEAATPGLSRRWLIGGAVAAAGLAAAGVWRGEAPDPAAPLIEQAGVALRSGSAEGQRRALSLLEQAAARYPDSAAAWGALALARARIDEHAITRITQPAAKVDEAATRALRLDPGNADAQAARAIVIPYYGDWLAAEQRFDGVVAAHPRHLPTHDSRGFLLGAVGRMKQSARDRFRTMPMDVVDADYNFRSVYCHWFLGQIAQADQAAARGLALWPGHAGNWFAKLWVLAGTGRFDRALDQIADERQRPKLPPPTVATLGAAMRAAMTKDEADTAAATRQVMAGVSRSVAGVINAVMLLNLLRANDALFALAEAYYLERGPVRAAMTTPPGEPLIPDQRRRKTNMMFTPLAAPMQDDDRFLPLMQAIGLADYWRRRGIRPDFLARRQ